MIDGWLARVIIKAWSHFVKKSFCIIQGLRIFRPPRASYDFLVVSGIGFAVVRKVQMGPSIKTAKTWGPEDHGSSEMAIGASSEQLERWLSSETFARCHCFCRTRVMS